tara:strand:+ start:5020 stop:5979 length:960 start_codon:yes stop_codon:yes gene_type:complete
MKEIQIKDDLYKEISQNLDSIIQKKLLANGYIFYGPEGVGKKQIALKFINNIFNQYSFNSNIEERISTNNHPDFLLIEPTTLIKSKELKKLNSDLSKKNSGEIIRIEQIRSIKNFLSQKSIESEKKIVLINNAHLLNESSSNCLLKTLEEPSNGIFILITSKKNLLLDTIISRCQLVRFKAFSRRDFEILLRENLDNSMFEICKKLNVQDLINSANGSPSKFLNNLDIWSKLSSDFSEKINYPFKNNLEILKISKIISEQLEIYQQIFLINFIQIKWWRETKNSNIIMKLETLKSYIKNFIQPRFAWEVTLLQIAAEDF